MNEIADVSKIPTDEYPVNGITIRRGHHLGTQVFIGGWRVGFYKTDRGMWKRILSEIPAQTLSDIVEGRIRPGRTDEENLMIWNLAIDEENDNR